MSAVIAGDSHTEAQQDAGGIAPPRILSAEALAYIALALLAFTLRVADLDAIPLSHDEARLALAAWHSIEPDAPGRAPLADSPLTYIAQLFGFSFLGAGAFSARVIVALAGVALSLCPLLFRELFGATRCFIWSALLAFLTIPLAASRTADGAIFMLLFTVLAMWQIRRYWYSQRQSDAIWAVVCVSGMALLSSPSGLALLVILLAAGWLAVWRTAISAPQRLDLPGDDILQLALKQLREFPFGLMLLVPLAVALPICALFMLNPAGLSSLGQLIESAISGISQSYAHDDMRVGFISLLAYEPLLIIFALGGAWLLWRHGDVTYIDRFAAAWAAAGALGLLLYPGAKPADALWVVLPLTMLASYGIAELMVDRRAVLLWQEDAEENPSGQLYSTQFWWVKWIIAVGALLFIFIVAVQFQQWSRLLLQLPPGIDAMDIFSHLMDSAQLRLLQSIGLLLITLIITVIVFLLVANYWGGGTCLQGIGLGFAGLLFISGVGGGWQLATGSDPDGVWRQAVVTDESLLLRSTMFELADRESLGFPLLEITMVEDNESLRDDGYLAWLLRDFPNVRFAPVASIAAGDPIILTRHEDPQAQELPGNYVGQSFQSSRGWSLAQAGFWDLPAWWTQGLIREGQTTAETLTLWLRQDVYDGIPVELRAS